MTIARWTMIDRRTPSRQEMARPTGVNVGPIILEIEIHQEVKQYSSRDWG